MKKRESAAGGGPDAAAAAARKEDLDARVEEACASSGPLDESGRAGDIRSTQNFI
jgi:hypothetical protein